MLAKLQPKTFAGSDALPYPAEIEGGLDQWDNEGGSHFLAPIAPASPAATHSREFPRYHNELGVLEIRIGADEFHCIGALPPGDHPHIYLNMSGKAGIRCPYCATNFVRDERLRWDMTEPSGCLYEAATA